MVEEDDRGALRFEWCGHDVVELVGVPGGDRVEVESGESAVGCVDDDEGAVWDCCDE